MIRVAAASLIQTNLYRGEVILTPKIPKKKKKQKADVLRMSRNIHSFLLIIKMEET